MKIVYNNIIPTRGHIAMTIWPWVFVRHKWRYTTMVNNHEHIHGEQQKEMIFVGMILTAAGFALGLWLWSFLFPLLFYWLYALEYVIRLAIYRSHKKAYRNISTEQEAYANQNDMMYIDKRRHFAWVRYMFKKNNK